MKTSKLSIIVPVYNAEKYLKDCLNSLLCQSVNGGYEIVCVNDGSKDSSQQILDEYSQSYPEIIKVFNKNNGGVSSARNFGIHKASGKFITFVDSDDYILPNSVGQVVDFLEKENALAAIVKAYKNVELDSKFSNELIAPKLSYNIENISSSSCCTLIVDRELVVSNGIEFNEKMRVGEDTVFVAECQIYYWNRCLSVEGGYYCYRQNPNSAMHTKDHKKDLQSHIGMLDTYEKIFSKIKKEKGMPEELIKQFERRLYASVSNVLFAAAFAGEDLLEEFKSRKLYPYPIQWWMLKGNRTFKAFVVSFLKQCFTVEWIYKIFYNSIR